MKTITKSFTIEITAEEADKLAQALQYCCFALNKQSDPDKTDKEYFARKTAETLAIKKDIVNLRNEIGGLVGISYYGE